MEARRTILIGKSERHLLERVCFTMRVAREHIPTYVAMHEHTWPELLAELDRSGWRNYSLFLRDDGFLIGYLESPDFAAAQAAMDRTEVAPRWSVEMDRLVVPGTRMVYLQHALADTPTGTAQHRRAFVLPSADPERIGPVAAALLERARDDGWRNSSLFVRDDATVVGYAEHESPAADVTALAGTWADALGAAAASTELREVFNLGAQLRRMPR